MKRTVSLFLIVLTLMVCFISSASASNKDFNFYMTSGGTSNHSALTKKSGGVHYENKWYVTPKSSLNGVSSNWVVGETCRFRARDSSSNEASSLYSFTQTSGYGLYDVTFNRPYSITSVGGDYYMLFADKPANDPYGPLRLVGTWCP